MPDPYSVLGVERDADEAAIKKAYRAAAMRWHPDRNPDDPNAEARFKAAADAYAILSDPQKRHALDGSAGPSGVPDSFLEDVASALDRAEGWVERAVVPHYARFLRGEGVEMRVRLRRDLDDLVPGTFTPEHTAFSRWRARRMVRKIHIGVYDYKVGSVSHVRPTRDGGYEILVTPWILWEQGFRESTDIDDALLRILLARYVQILIAGYWIPPDADWDALIAEARRADSIAMAWNTVFGLVWAGVGGVMLTMLYYGWPR